MLPPTPENLRVIGDEVERLGRLLGALRSLNELESEDVERASTSRSTWPRWQRVPPTAHRSGVRGQGRRRSTRTCGRSTVKGDRDRLLQVVGNLLDNALKFTPEGGHVTLAVAAAAARLPTAAPARAGCRSRSAALTVTDDGPGIDPIDLPFIFDRFYRAQAARGTLRASVSASPSHGRSSRRKAASIAGVPTGPGWRRAVHGACLPAASHRRPRVAAA